jgi:uncharacterized protein (DUF1800 family)
MRRSVFLLTSALALGCANTESPGDGAHEDEHVAKAAQAVESLQAPSRANVIRFLEQSSFGPRTQDINHVKGVGISQAITEQLGKPAGTYTGWDGNSAPPPPTQPYSARDAGADVFEHAIAGDDQLRQRVAIALSQIFVVSLTTIGTQGPVADYLSMLRRDAFGNFLDLLRDVTLHPAMGKFLNMANNTIYAPVPAGSPAGTPNPIIAPDENYAREVMQLFTMGLDELYDDGTRMLDCTGDGVADPPATCKETTAGAKPIATYSQDAVENLAHTLTGWTYDDAAHMNGAAKSCPGKSGRKGEFYGGKNTPALPSIVAPKMIGCANNHDSASTTLLNGFATTAGAAPQVHLEEALGNLFNDNSTPPFICKQLIQHLVTSNPSAPYVSRVVAKFKNDGQGVRGNLAAVVRAILEDDEARGPVPPVAQLGTFGHLRSPILLITNPIRWLNGAAAATAYGTSGSALNGWSSRMGQNFPRPPSVFSYYPPGYRPKDGNGLLAPEFALANTGTTLDRGNYLNQLLFSGLGDADSLAAISGVTVDLTVVPADQGAMVEWISQNLFHEAMSSALKGTILDAIGQVAQARQKSLALYLAFSSPEYQIQR